jgi:hypothetical protein
VCLVFVFYHDSVFNTSSICRNHMCISSGNIRVIPDVDSLFAFVLFVGTLRVLSLVTQKPNTLTLCCADTVYHPFYSNRNIAAYLCCPKFRVHVSMNRCIEQIDVLDGFVFVSTCIVCQGYVFLLRPGVSAHVLDHISDSITESSSHGCHCTWCFGLIIVPTPPICS